MANMNALNTLIELAVKETEDAAQRLAAALRACEEAEQKLDLLLQYRNDYAARCQSSLENGISTGHFNNFRLFMQKLDHAIAGQQKVSDNARQHMQHARSVWQTCEQKKMSFTTLADRARREDTRRELWRDQKMNDEHAARRALHKRPSNNQG